MIKKRGLFSSVTITNATDNWSYGDVPPPCPTCAALRAIVARCEDVDALEAFLDGDESRTMAEAAQHLRDYLLKGG